MCFEQIVVGQASTHHNQIPHQQWQWCSSLRLLPCAFHTPPAGGSGARPRYSQQTAYLCHLQSQAWALGALCAAQKTMPEPRRADPCSQAMCSLIKPTLAHTATALSGNATVAEHGQVHNVLEIGEVGSGFAVPSTHHEVVCDRDRQHCWVGGQTCCEHSPSNMRACRQSV